MACNIKYTGQVTLQFLRAMKVLKSFVSLESKFHEEPLAPNYKHQLVQGCVLPFSPRPEGASQDRWLLLESTGLPAG